MENKSLIKIWFEIELKGKLKEMTDNHLRKLKIFDYKIICTYIENEKEITGMMSKISL